MRTLLKIVLLATIGAHCQISWCIERSSAEIKGDSLRQLQELRGKNVKRLAEVDSALSKKIEDTKSNNIEIEVQKLRVEKKEYLMRQELLDRLIFQLDTKFNGGDLRAFLERVLVDMAKIDAASSSSSEGLWKFLKYSSDAIRRLPEQKENILAFLEGYMNLSVSNPILPEVYLASRNYTNGSRSESGNPLERDQVGALADKRLRQISVNEKTQAIATPEQKVR